ncbi:MAG: hypothetical protein H8E29_15015 [Anaerolineales bacterium]|uniref:Uncharacterized protein n=1 Tax=Candidatus Desulfolinea nitratireducens TaxID=2841698 RepID=A0A8J6NNX2_9CHLR|nr:hypothetical protein [Candidatus Desulfolinea nitratireducens]
MKSKIQNIGWIIFILFGLLQISSGLPSLCILCMEPGHWDWLTSAPEVLEYLNLTWRWLGVTSLAFGVWTLAIAATAFRKGERWAWFAMWVWPAYLAAQGIVFPFQWPAMRILIVFALIGLFVPYRIFFPKKQEQKTE